MHQMIFPAALIAEVARAHGMRPEHIRKNGCKKIQVVRARWEAFYVLRRDRRLSLTKIATLMGGFDHTSVLHGIRRHAEINGLPDLAGMRPVRV